MVGNRAWMWTARAVIAAGLVALVQAPGRGDTITITIDREGGIVKVAGGTPPVKPSDGVLQGFTSGADGKSNIHSLTDGSLDSMGNGQLTNGGQPLVGTVSVSNAGHSWHVVKDGTYTSKDEEPPDPNAPIKSASNGLPFAPPGGFVFFVGNSPFAQFSLTNTSTATAYMFTAMSLYQNLDPAFFTAGGYASAAAIASGTLVEDMVATEGPFGLGPVGGPGASYLDVSVGPIIMGDYELLTGTAVAVLDNGQFGPPTNFSVAMLGVPEPSSLAYMGTAGAIGWLGMAARSRRRRPR